MAITVTEILGTDSISASRIVINDNFAILRDEVNSIQTYLDTNAGTIDGLNSLETLNLSVGQPGNYVLEASLNNINLNIDTVLNGNITIDGTISNNSFGILDETTFPTGITTINPVNGFSNYVIVHSSTSTFNIVLDEGLPGQLITLSIEQKGGGDIILSSGTNTTFVLDTSSNEISFNDIGSTVTMKYMIDSTNNGAWFIVSSHNITLV